MTTAHEWGDLMPRYPLIENSVGLRIEEVSTTYTSFGLERQLKVDGAYAIWYRQEEFDRLIHYGTVQPAVPAPTSLLDSIRQAAKEQCSGCGVVLTPETKGLGQVGDELVVWCGQCVLPEPKAKA